MLSLFGHSSSDSIVLYWEYVAPNVLFGIISPAFQGKRNNDVFFMFLCFLMMFPETFEP